MRDVTIYFDYVSPFPYLLNEYLIKHDVVQRYDLKLEWVAIFLGSLWPELGHLPPTAADARKTRYVMIEAHRYAEELGVSYRANFFKPIPSLRAVLAAKRQGCFADFHTALARELQGQGSVPDEDLFRRIISSVGGDADALIADMNSAPIKQELIDNAERAKKEQVFGVPFAIYKDQPYWGYNHFPYLMKVWDQEEKS
jgi:2-hydroxychromene-2-carboxylate isomerase